MVLKKYKSSGNCEKFESSSTKIKEETESEDLYDIEKDVCVSDELYDLKAISLNGDFRGNKEEKNRPVLELPEDEFEPKVDQWNLGQEPIKDRIVQAEHFDKT